MPTIVFDNIRGSEIADKLKALKPEKHYAVSIQDLASRQAIIDEMEAASLAGQLDPAVAGKSEAEIMDKVAEIIEKYRLETCRT